MILETIIEPNPILHKKSKELTLEEIQTEDIQNLIKQMIPTMYLKDGVGLAAPQINRSLQICVIHKNYTDKKDKDLVLVNPVWKKVGIFKDWDEEGCLSVPNTFGKVKRYKKIKVKALDRDGNKLEFTASNFFARVIQHEVDHLNGILFIEKARDIHKAYKE
jgi:peptide deformylase